MRSSHSLPAAVLLIAAAFGSDDALAQFGTAFPGFVQLPDNDFTWIWGADEEGEMRGAPDFRTRGNEAGFRCDLTGRLRVSSRMSSNDVRMLEQSLSTSLAFIQVSAETMTIMDRRLELDWARLTCEKLRVDPDAEEEQERLDRALQKAIRDRERRRAREREED